MTKLAFVVPTWNRPKQLEVCVESIAGQVRPDDDVRVIVLDDGSTDITPGICAQLAEKYQCVEVRRRPVNGGDYAPAFLHMFRAAPDAEWVWTFGDDDQLRPNALAFMLSDILPRMEKRDFFHVTENTRASGTNGIVAADGLLDLCCTFGWIEMTGFITGNVCRGSLLSAAADTPRWAKYAKSAFVQSSALLETLRDRPCAFVDIPLIATQNNEQSEDTTRRWIAANIPTRYMFAADCIELMYEDGILKDKVPAKFFRYLNYHLWDRFLVSFINDYANQKALWPDWAWAKTSKFADFVLEEDIAKQIVEDVDAARGMATLGLFLEKNADGIRQELAGIGERRSASVYPYAFTEPPARAADAYLGTRDIAAPTV